MRHVYTEAQKEFLINHSKGLMTPELTELFNKEFGTALTNKQISAFKKNHQCPGGVFKRVGQSKLYSKEEQEFLIKTIPGRTFPETTKLFNEKFGRDLTEKQIRGFAHNRGHGNGLDGRFKKGHIPENKIKKGDHICPRTEFKKGHPAGNKLPVGSLRYRKNKYHPHYRDLFIKIAEPDKWVLYSRWLWEKHYGPIPNGKVITTRDGDRENIVLENLILVDKSSMPYIQWNGRDIPTRQTVIALAELKTAINKRQGGQ